LKSSAVISPGINDIRLSSQRFADLLSHFETKEVLRAEKNGLLAGFLGGWP
jgi:hypothetical protein